MAETYLTPTFQNAAKPPADAPAAAAPDATAPAAAQTGGEQYQTPTFKKAVAPPPPVDSGGGQTTGGTQNQSNAWTLNPQTWNVPMPQSVQDWGTVAGNEAMATTIPSLRAQAEAARKRLDPATAASADFAGNVLSPTQLLTPVAGPEAAGGAHEGIKSAVTNWKPDESWGDYFKNVGEDTGLGALFGHLGRWTASQAPGHFGDATREMIKGLPGAAIGLHAVNAGADFAHNMGTAAEAFGLYGGLNRFGTWAGKKVEDLGSSPYVQQAIKSVILGGGSTARQQVPGPLDQLFMPGN
jgi:hypothetical protein